MEIAANQGNFNSKFKSKNIVGETFQGQMVSSERLINKKILIKYLFQVKSSLL